MKILDHLEIDLKQIWVRVSVHVQRIGNGYAHEAMEVGRCLREGLLESPEMPLGETVELMGVLDELRSQLGIRYANDR